MGLCILFDIIQENAIYICISNSMCSPPPPSPLFILIAIYSSLGEKLGALGGGGEASPCPPMDRTLPGKNIWTIPYSRKYWRALNLAVEPQIAVRRVLADLNLAVRYGIAIRIYASRKFWRILIWRL